jgi:hypothetical protein
MLLPALGKAPSHTPLNLNTPPPARSPRIAPNAVSLPKKSPTSRNHHRVGERLGRRVNGTVAPHLVGTAVTPLSRIFLRKGPMWRDGGNPPRRRARRTGVVCSPYGSALNPRTRHLVRRHQNCGSGSTAGSKKGWWNMERSTGRPVTCADCGARITGERILISATEQLCEDCWPFLLRPIPLGCLDSERLVGGRAEEMKSPLDLALDSTGE